jgi:hypothetical protein
MPALTTSTLNARLGPGARAQRKQVVSARIAFGMRQAHTTDGSGDRGPVA